MDVHVERLSKDLKDAAATLSDEEARYLVDAYYIIQEDRKRSGNQVRALDKSEEPHLLLGWFFDQNKILESQLKMALERYSDTKPIGLWMKSIHGIGPVIASGIMAHIDIKKSETAGDIWRFAGLDPTRVWEPKTKRPWNASLKTLCWHIGQCFMKFSADERCIYGHKYKERKAFEVARNDTGYNAKLAKKLLRKFNPKTEAYKHLKNGKLPPAHVDARARRWVVKLFISHVQAVWWEMETGEKPAKPYILTRGHSHMIEPPNWPMGTT
jgi:Transposase IS116/IS110/IS902 family